MDPKNEYDFECCECGRRYCRAGPFLYYHYFREHEPVTQEEKDEYKLDTDGVREAKLKENMGNKEKKQWIRMNCRSKAWYDHHMGCKGWRWWFR